MRAVLNILALAGGVIGSVLIASASDFARFGYIFFLVSSSTSAMLQWNDKTQRGLLGLSMFYIGVNVFGLLRWFSIL